MQGLGRLGLLAIVAALFAAGQPATAQQTPAAGTERGREYDAAFQAMMQQPADLDVLFKFATVAAQAGDMEGAISALERMLLINPDLPRVRLELGVLYFRLGSYEIANTYLETALASPAVPPDVRGRAEQFLAEIRKRQSPSRIFGEVFGGVRYQSNANLGPPTSSVRLFGQTANLNQSSIGTADWGVLTSGYIRHVYDLGTQDRAALETQLTGYVNRQFQISAANVSIIDLTMGPRFQVLQGIAEDVSVKPFFTGGYIWVNDTPFYGAFGAGLEVGTLITDRLRNTSNFVWRRQMHPDTWYVPTNSQFTGWEYSGNTTFQYQINEALSIFTNGNLQRFQTDNAPWQSYQLYGVGGGMSFRFNDPLFKSDLAWSIGLSVNLQWWTYDQPDVVIDSTVNRLQNDTILNITLAIPFDERTTLTVSAGRFVRGASLPNYQFVNNSFLMGVGWRF